MGSLFLLIAEAGSAPAAWVRGALLALALAIIITTVALLAHVWRTRQQGRRRRPAGPPSPSPHPFGTLARRVRMGSGPGAVGSSLSTTEAASDIAPRLRIAARRRRNTPTGVIAKHCPRCGLRYDLALTHCEKDGIELRTLN